MARYKLLLIEDNEDDIDLVRYAIHRSAADSSIDLVVSRSGEEGLAYLSQPLLVKNQSELPALILLDIKLPGIDGLDVLRQIRAHPVVGRLPVVLLTTSDSEEDVDNGYRFGANSFVRKPDELSSFCSLFNQLGVLFASESFELKDLPYQIPRKF